MGASLASNLQKAGHKLVVHDVRRGAAEPHVAAGAVWAATPREVAAGSEVIFTSLPGPPEVEAVALGKDGLLDGIKPGAAYFDLSTNSRNTVRKIHAAFTEKGAQMLDAPVSGGPRGAKTGKLAIWVGGDKDTYERHEAVLRAMGDQPRYVGPIGQATVAKLVHNCAGYAIGTALAEVFTMGVKAGVDPLTLFEAVRQGALGRRRTFDGLIDQFLPGVYDPPAFMLRHAHKDVSLAVALGKEVAVPMRLCNLTLEEMTEALNRGWAERDSRAALLLQQERAGVAIAVDKEQLQDVVKRG
jgi:3-hydroxyisobutyrate dehydrogenase